MEATLYTTGYQNNKKEKSTKHISFLLEERDIEMGVINLYPDLTYQTFDGFGGALTEAAGYALGKMGEEIYQEVISAYYGEKGIGYTFGRVHLDSCDFALSNYSAVEDGDDKEFTTFSLKRDEQYVQPLIRKVLDTACKEVSLLMSPWSPPAFMKTTGQRNAGGKLIKECYADWARYICRYLLEYRKIGIEITMLTLQNEPGAATPWDSCQFSAEEEKILLRDYLYPEMKKQGLDDIGLYIWDHNKERLLERAQVIIDETTSPMIAGIAFHWYTGDHFDTVRMTQELFPDKKLIHSEGCVEYSKFGEGDELRHAQVYAHDIIGDLNAGMTAYIDWNIALDESGGPNHIDNFCGAPVMYDAEAKSVIYRLTFDYIAHFSSYINPGAKRIGCSKYTDDLEMTAFKNIDGTIITVLLNRHNHDIKLTCRIGGQIAVIQINKKSIATLLINP